MIWSKGMCLIIASICIIVWHDEVEGYRKFQRGRRYGGFLGKPKVHPNVTFPPEQWFEQQLDHFNPTSSVTWKQRYFTNASFHTPGGPVFLMIGGEAPASPEWMVEGQWIEYAERYNALCFQLEHRYYGKSQPTRNVAVKNMVYLSSEQALADLAFFIEAMTIQHELPASTKWIVFGGSYPGSLAAWMRAKYPHLVHGAVSASAPLLAKADFREYYRIVQDDLSSSNSSCVTAIKDATKQLQLLLKHAVGQDTVNKIFKLCNSIDVEEKNDVSNLFDSLAGNFAGVAQYNNDNRDFEGSGSNITLNTLCDIMDNETIGTPVHRYAAVNSLILDSNEQTCLDYKYQKMIYEMEQVDWHCEAASDGGRQWMYQTCTEFGFYQTSSLTAKVFGDEFPVDFFIQQCSDIFSKRFDRSQVLRGIKRTNTIYGALHQTASRVVYVHGSVDPWHALGITRTVHKESPAIFIQGTAHCADMYPSSPSDPPQLKNARKKISDLIGLWLDQSD